jgi:hypothetical protein
MQLPKLKTNSMRPLLFCQRAIVCVTLLATTVFAAVPRPHFIDSKAVDIKAVLSDPSAPGSLETLRELEFVLARQAQRTPTDEARAKREGHWSPFLFDVVLGSWFTAQNLPVTSAFLDTVGHDTMAVSEIAKKIWGRPRPPLQDKRVHPSVGLPSSSSYPSGHGTYGFVLGAVLAQLAPDLKEQLIARGEEIGDDRVLGGVHFLSDVEAGRKLGRAILSQLEASPEFQAGLEKAKQEFEQVRARQVAAPKIAGNKAPSRVAVGNMRSLKAQCLL